MPIRIELDLSPEQATQELSILEMAARKSGLKDVSIVKIRQSIDARRAPIRIKLLLDVYGPDEKVEQESWSIQAPKINTSRKAIIVGFGPAGMFAALELLEAGIIPIVIERGKKVKERRRDLAVLNRNGDVDPESNYCFGEGGAGTYSDGKLYTRSKKRGDVRKILEIFVAHGANERILYEAHPHIGTNKLPQIVEAIRETILQHGGEIYFNEKLTKILVKDHKIEGIQTASGMEILADQVILATGHSARDVFEMLHSDKILIEEKPFALGLRIEHPQTLIDSIQYKCETRGEYLPPASYSLVEQVKGRGVFSFCMCPGGIIAPAATTPGEIVVNGWSPSKRNGKFANSGMVVSVDAKDWTPFKDYGPLAAMKYQESVEKSAYHHVQNKLMAPAQKLLDFIKNKESYELPACSYIPGVKSVNLHHILPKEVAYSLQTGLAQIGKKVKGYLSSESILVGVESRTSSPVKIPRDKITLEHLEISGLYPCGEGAGYAGGIVSAALDGVACARKIAEAIH